MLNWFRPGPSPHQTGIAMVGAKPGQLVVVVGASSPQLAAEIARVTGLNGRTVVADDAAARERVEAAAREAGALLDFEAAGPTALPADAETQDLVVLISALAARDDADRGTCIGEAWRILKPGGRIIVIEGTTPSRGFAGFGRGKAAHLDPSVATNILTLLGRTFGKATRQLADVDGVAYFEAEKIPHVSLVWPIALGLSVAGSAGGLLVASLLLLFHKDVRTRVVPWLVSYAVGTLLGAALLGLLPQSLETLAPTSAFGTLLAGILTFFILEKLVLWRHSHDEDEPHVHRSTATLVIAGDTVHTFVDGVVIAAATLVSPWLGVTTALAVIAHEIPQEAGDFAVLLASGLSRSRALLLNLASALGGLAGATVMLLWGSQAPRVLPYVLAFAAGNFMYVSMADLIPNLHRGNLDRNAVRQVALIALGILTIVLM